MHGISRQKSGISRQKASRGRSPPQRKISRPKSLSLCCEPPDLLLKSEKKSEPLEKWPQKSIKMAPKRPIKCPIFNDFLDVLLDSWGPFTHIRGGGVPKRHFLAGVGLSSRSGRSQISSNLFRGSDLFYLHALCILSADSLGDFSGILLKSPRIISGQNVQSMRVKRLVPQKD